MTSKKLTMFIIGSSTLALSSCSVSSTNSVQNTSTELNTKQNELITQLNSVYELESTLQSTFETSLAENPELTSFSNGNSEVFENIEQRSNSIEMIKDLNSDIQSNAEDLAEYEGEELDAESVQSLGENFLSFTNTLTEYTESYSTALENQESYFNTIGSEDATYEEFANGINTINQEQQNLQETMQIIDDQLVELQSQLDDLIAATEESSSQEG